MNKRKHKLDKHMLKYYGGEMHLYGYTPTSFKARLIVYIAKHKRKKWLKSLLKTKYKNIPKVKILEEVKEK